MAVSLVKPCRFCNSAHYHKSHRSILIGLHSSRTKATSPNILPRPSKSALKAVVGLEIHAQINSASKLFSGSSTKYGASTNSQVAFLDAALPGTLPVLNKRCVEAGVLTALALGCQINRVSTFDRKHYFYADLPAGYQITQFRKPLAQHGQVPYVYQCSQTSQLEKRRASITQIQLEQDSGKSLHDLDQGLSLIDLNRAGIGLMEIVTEPDFTSGDDAASFVRDLRDILLTVGSCDGKMAEGSMRVDANVSVHKSGDPLGIRTEVKNLNSFRAIRLAVDFEIERHKRVLSEGGFIINETRSFDDSCGETIPMRDKEKMKDYRFMPEPNLPPLVLDTGRPGCVSIPKLQSQMKELPEQTRTRLQQDYQLPLMQAMLLVRNNLQDRFEQLVKEHSCPPLATVFVLRSLDSIQWKRTEENWSEVSGTSLAQLIQMYDSDKIGGTCLPEILVELAQSPDLKIEEVIERKNLWNADADLIANVIQDVMKRNPKMVRAYRRGKTNQLKALTFKVMTRLEGKATTGKISALLVDKLKE